MKLYRSDWIGIILGIALGAYQPFIIINKPMFSNFGNDALIQILLFGLIGPPILALITKFIINSDSKIQEKIGQYINLFFMMIAYGIITGIVGTMYHLILGLPNQALMPIVFFGAAGFGFLGAYFIHPALAYRPNDKA